MATIFPPSPSVDDEYQGYKWDGTTWNLIGNQYNPASFSATAPSNPKPGDIWIESDVDVPSISPETILTTSVAASTYATQENFPAGAWQSYTPVWGSNGTQPVLNNGIISGSYTRIGKTIHYRISMTIGSTSSLGTGTRYGFTLPSTGKNLYPMATGFYFDTSLNQWYSVWGRTTTTSIDTMWIAAGPNGLTGGTLGAANPVVPAAGDIYFFNGTYEEA